jgi:hypothetical protein
MGRAEIRRGDTVFDVIYCSSISLSDMSGNNGIGGSLMLVRRPSSYYGFEWVRQWVCVMICLTVLITQVG